MVPKASLAHERSGFEFGTLIGIGSGKSGADDRNLSAGIAFKLLPPIARCTLGPPWTIAAYARQVMRNPFAIRSLLPTSYSSMRLRYGINDAARANLIEVGEGLPVRDVDTGGVTPRIIFLANLRGRTDPMTRKASIPWRGLTRLLTSRSAASGAKTGAGSSLHKPDDQAGHQSDDDDDDPRGGFGIVERAKPHSSTSTNQRFNVDRPDGAIPRSPRSAGSRAWSRASALIAR